MEETSPSEASLNCDSMKGSSEDRISPHEAHLSLAQESSAKMEAHLSKNNVDNTTQTAMAAKGHFMDTIPAEIRLQIYEELLVDPTLSTSWCIHRLGGIGCRPLGLFPAILRTCAQIHKEASPILYGSNRFLMAFLSEGHNHHVGYPIIQTALTRHEQALDNSRESQYKTKVIITPGIRSVFRQVRHWKLLVSRVIKGDLLYTPSLTISKFCEMVCEASPTSLEVIFIPEVAEALTVDNPVLEDAEQTVSPLRILRNVGTFSMRIATADELPCEYHPRPTIEDTDKVEPEVEKELRELVTGSLTVELPFKMWKPLLRYARAFERHGPFKHEMGTGLYEDNDNLNLTDSEEASRLGDQARRQKNPFKGYHYQHTVEDSLDHAREACKHHNAMTFKEHRAKIIEYLEPQYWDILKRRKALSEFIEKEIKEGNKLLSFSLPDVETRMYLALAYLGDYAKSFERHLDMHTRALMLKRKHKYDLIYDNLPRELAMKKLDQAVQLENYHEFHPLFQSACQDMDAQLLEMVLARQELFSHDVTPERGCDIDEYLGKGQTMIPVYAGDHKVNEKGAELTID
ncbi:hypothetical protein BDZ45DRAFT_772498 [Acephala macrosclerotiorum]|nr:hypothetical protein BDZ45DRAFT_772498 [Acephala macrosclerotiorum]